MKYNQSADIRGPLQLGERERWYQSQDHVDYAGEDFVSFLRVSKQGAEG